MGVIRGRLGGPSPGDEGDSDRGDDDSNERDRSLPAARPDDADGVNHGVLASRVVGGDPAGESRPGSAVGVLPIHSDQFLGAGVERPATEFWAGAAGFSGFGAVTAGLALSAGFDR